ncbi:hypothetical protein [Rhizobium sp. BK379]|uniref:hypothetical protein n=1 Tax=Rhizobium sp. BK379 TaxID=2587059 RepID=UPI00161F45D7|nr:hypothetical protein [Rhizobium sp. BK379]MBB3440987.1 hypothetical protein [Rhizobium sp. BK379]
MDWGLSADQMELIVLFFARRELTSSTPIGSSASVALNVIRTEQNDVHRRFANHLWSLGQGISIGGTNPYSGTVNRLRDDIAPHVMQRLSIEQYTQTADVDPKPVFKSLTPILLEREFDELITRLESPPSVDPARTAFLVDLVATLLAAYLNAFVYVLNSYDDGFPDFVRARVRMAATQLGMIDASHRQVRYAESRAAGLNMRIDDAVASSEKLRADLATLKVQFEAVSQDRDSLRQDMSNSEKEFSDVKGRIASASTALREQLGLKETQALWGAHAKWASISYGGSLFVLLAILIGLPVGAYAGRNEILDLVKLIEGSIIASDSQTTGVTATVIAAGRLLLLGVPIGAIIWAIKLIVRFNMRSMLLMDDARQRVTMLNTYLFLVKQDVAQVQDRGALLEAMFRRAPGHGPETIEPPTMTDVMKYGQEIGK